MYSLPHHIRSHYRRGSTYNLQFDGLAIQFYCSDFEVNTDRADVAFCIRVVLSRAQRKKVGTFMKRSTLPLRGVRMASWYYNYVGFKKAPVFSETALNSLQIGEEGRTSRPQNLQSVAV